MDLSKSKSRQTDLSLDRSTRRWCAKVGRKRTSGGKIDGHKFRFNQDKKESERRKHRIHDLWDSLVEDSGQNAIWDDEALTVAKAIAEGKREIVFSVEQLAPNELLRLNLSAFRSQDRLYAKEIARLQKRFPGIAIVAEDERCLEKGRQAILNEASQIIDREKTKLRELDYPVHSNQGATVAEALDAYEVHIKATMMTTPDLEEGSEGKRLTQTAQSYLKQIARIREHNADHLQWPLSKLTFDGCEAFLLVWRLRPMRKDGTAPMAVKTCREHAKRIKDFFRWLSRTDQFDWKKPVDFDELRLNVQRTNKEKSAPITSQNVRTYTVEELAILNEYAVPIERFLLLCGLNCGFKRMECATLRVGEIQLREMHPFAKYIDFDFKCDNSFVRRLRTKTEVYGEWILWPLTVRAMEWVSERRKTQTHILFGVGAGRAIPCSKDALVLLNDSGHSFAKPTKSGNPNHQLTNAWSRLLRRVKQDHADFPWLPQESLRDTASNWIREKFDGEVADIFLSHGSPLGSKSLIECYTNKPFGKVFSALRWLEDKLTPVFAATPNDPFPAETKKGGGGLTLKQQKRIKELAKKGLSKKEIAKRVGCSSTTVYRIQKKQEL